MTVMGLSLSSSITAKTSGHMYEIALYNIFRVVEGDSFGEGFLVTDCSKEIVLKKLKIFWASW